MDHLKQVQKRTFQYWYSDGLNEIGLGALMLLLGIYFFLEVILETGHPLRFILESGFVIVIVGGSVLINKFIRAGKERLTYRRTGFIDYPRRRAPAWTRALLGAIIGGVTSALVSYLAVSNMDIERWLPAINGIILAAVLLYIGLRVSVPRFLLLSLATLVIGGGITLLGMTGSPAYGLFYVLSGLSVIISGTLTLIGYMNNHPVEAETGNEP